MMNIQIEQSPQIAALLTADDLAMLLRCSTRSIRRLADQGSVPRPVKIGGLLRWSREVIERWIEDGCPACRRGRRGR